MKNKTSLNCISPIRQFTLQRATCYFFFILLTLISQSGNINSSNEIIPFASFRIFSIISGKQRFIEIYLIEKNTNKKCEFRKCEKFQPQTDPYRIYYETKKLFFKKVPSSTNRSNWKQLRKLLGLNQNSKYKLQVVEYKANPTEYIYHKKTPQITREFNEEKAY